MPTFPLNGLKVVETLPQGGAFVPKATDLVTDEVEGKLACRLPPAYREWAKIYGAGELAGYFRIAAPMDLQHTFNLVDFNRSMKEGEDGNLLRERVGAGLFETAIFFAESISGDIYCWDRRIQADAGSDEFPIYYSPRHSQPEKCAETFMDWILKTCLTPAIDEEGESRWYFRRFYVE